MFWKKKRKPRIWIIPEEHAEIFLKMYDSTDPDLTSDVYRLWKFIFKILPEVEKEQYKYSFTIDVTCATQPRIKEKI